MVAALDVAQLAADLAIFRDGAALLHVLALDVAALLVAAVGPLVGRHFGSIVLRFVGVGLPIALLGAAFDALGGDHLSAQYSAPQVRGQVARGNPPTDLRGQVLSGSTSLVGAGAGLCSATSANRTAGVLGVIATAAGAHLTTIASHPRAEAILLVAPLTLCAILGVGLGLRAPAIKA